MTNARPNLFTRDDTMFGVCQGLGEDLGFNPDYLRVALPLLLFVQPVATIAGYAVAGVVVFGVRWFMPSRFVPAITHERELAAPASLVIEDQPLPLAA